MTGPLSKAVATRHGRVARGEEVEGVPLDEEVLAALHALGNRLGLGKERAPEISGASLMADARRAQHETVGRAFADDVERIARAGREAMTQSEYLTACEKALRLVQSARMGLVVGAVRHLSSDRAAAVLGQPAEQGREHAP